MTWCPACGPWVVATAVGVTLWSRKENASATPTSASSLKGSTSGGWDEVLMQFLRPRVYRSAWTGEKELLGFVLQLVSLGAVAACHSSSAPASSFSALSDGAK